jgi:hypothetical protein
MEFGIRYALKLLSMVNNVYIPRRDTVAVAVPDAGPVSAKSVNAAALIYSLDGKAARLLNHAAATRMSSPGVYIIIDGKTTRNRIALVPFLRD